MADTSDGIGGLKYDKSKRAWPNEINIFVALIIIILIFEALGQLLPYMNGQSMLFDFNEKRDGTIKGRGCADGRKQRDQIPKHEVSSPTIST